MTITGTAVSIPATSSTPSATMLKATILADVNQRLNLNETDIDAKILLAIQKIISVVPGICEHTATVQILTGQYSGDLPDGFVNMIDVTNSDGQPLERVREISDLLALLNSNNTAGTPESFAIFGLKLYVNPPSSGGHALTIFYEYEDTSADTITMPDCAYEAITESVCSLLELERGLAGVITEQASGHERLANDAIAVLVARYTRRREA